MIPLSPLSPKGATQPGPDHRAIGVDLNVVPPSWRLNAGGKPAPGVSTYQTRGLSTATPTRPHPSPRSEALECVQLAAAFPSASLLAAVSSRKLCCGDFHPRLDMPRHGGANIHVPVSRLDHLGRNDKERAAPSRLSLSTKVRKCADVFRVNNGAQLPGCRWVG